MLYNYGIQSNAEAIQKAMDDAGIDLPFPTQVEVQNAHDFSNCSHLLSFYIRISILILSQENKIMIHPSK